MCLPTEFTCPISCVTPSILLRLQPHCDRRRIRLGPTWIFPDNTATIRGVIVLIILVGSLLIFRVAGVFGVAAFSTWVAAVRWALAAMFLFTGIAHFTKAKYSMARMVPQVFGNAMAWVYFTGLCEIAGAVGLLLPRFRSLAGICLILLLIAMFPANAKAIPCFRIPARTSPRLAPSAMRTPISRRRRATAYVITP